MEKLCPECGSDNVYFSKKRQKYICEDCECAFEAKSDVSAQKVFFSYGHDKNEVLVSMIKERLEQRGHLVWIDRSRIKAGDDWRRSITDGLTDTSTVLSFLSAHSVRTPGVCLDELKIALGVKRGYIKTILLEEESSVQVPTTVSDIQWLDLSDWGTHYQAGEQAFQAWFEEKVQQIIGIVESKESLNFAGEIQKLKGILAPSLLNTKEQFLLNKPYVGRKWLTQMVDDWLDKQDGHRAFVLVAGPGMGKSSFAANMLHYNPDVVCGLFCEWDKPETVSIKHVIRTIAFRLATKIADYRKILLCALADLDGQAALEKKTPEELFSFLLADPLNLLIDGNRSRYIILIDGLDEAASVEGDRLMRLLAERLKTLPPFVQFVLTSRPEHGVETIFEEYDPLVLRADDQMNAGDIRGYLALSLQQELTPLANKIEIIDRIVHNSEGSFLYATLVVDAVKKNTLNLEQADCHPVGLSSFYYTNFLRTYPDINSYKNIRDILELIVAAKVFPEDLLEICGVDSYEYGNLFENCGSLLSRSQFHVSQDTAITCISFCHKSMLDWLTDRSKASVFYIDVAKGAKRLVQKVVDILREYGLNRLAGEPVSQRNKLHKHLEANVAGYYVNGGCFAELEAFLCDPQTPFLPHWYAVSHFSEGWDMSALAKRLKEDAGAVEFFQNLQKSGDNTLALFLFRMIEKSYGIEVLPLEMFKIYTDLVHLSGEYRTAVQLSEQYLKKYTLDQITADKALTALMTRMLHHSKFFRPADKLLVEVDRLLGVIHAEHDCDGCLELLIMGGNMGTLTGNIEYSKQCNEKALRLSREKERKNFELRAVRKKTDLLKFEGRFQEAFQLLSEYITEDSELSSRYMVYLLCSLGEIHRHTGNFDRAYACYDRVRKTTEERGISGWWAHAMLGLGCLLSEHGFFSEAKYYLDQALKKYEAIEQLWGILTAKLYLLQLSRKTGEADAYDLDEIESVVKQLHYYSFMPFIDALKENATDTFFPLMFI